MGSSLGECKACEHKLEDKRMEGNWLPAAYKKSTGVKAVLSLNKGSMGILLR